MAVIRSKLFTGYHTTAPLPSNLVQWSLDARRSLIFFRRVKGDQIFGGTEPNTRDHEMITPYRDTIKDKPRESVAPNVAVHSKFTPNTQRQKLDDYIAIIDLDSKGPDKGYEVIKLPFVPRELSYNSESTFAAIKPMGRNTPLYHFTGSEDKLEFEIDWYAHDWGRREVIEKCRKIEALSKADGYTHSPHRVKLMWGKDDVLFGDHEFIVIAAPYKLSNFNKGNINANGNIESTYMLPIQAYQNVTLARISSTSLTSIDIQRIGKLDDTRSLNNIPS